SMRGVAPDWLAFFVGNMLVVGGFAELAVGFQQFFRGASRRDWVFGLLGLLAPWLFWTVNIAPNPSQRVFISSLFLGIVSVILVWEFASAARRMHAVADAGARAERRVLWALAITFGLGTLSFAWRGAAFYGVHGEIDAATLSGRTWAVSFLVGIVLNMALASSLPLLISRRNQRELQHNHELLADTEQLAQVASLVHEPDGPRTTANQVLREWLGADADSSISLEAFLAAVEPDARAPLSAQIQTLLSSEAGSWTCECRMLSAGRERWLSIHCGVKRSASGTRRLILSAQDVTLFREATEHAHKARDEANRANAAKSEFLANMSHEIRTPMNGVLGLTRICLEDELPARARSLIEKCHASAQTLMGVVNDVLDFSKIEAGQLALEHTAFDLRRTVDTARNLFEQQAGSKGLRFVVDIDPDVPLGLQGDPLRLSQVLNNLLSNAVKFTDKGEVRLHIRVENAQSDAVRLAFSVQDSGIGMSAQEQQRLFQPFAQADASTTRKYGGTGLGLVICRRLCDLMGGTLSVHSTPGQGTCFTLRLPFGVSALALHPLAQTTQKGRALLRNVHLLLVEDNPTNVLVATLSLEGEGARVTHCGDGLQAVNLLRDTTHGMDLVLMDIQMPVMDGYTATRAIRNDLGLTDLPIVAMTANVLESDLQASQDAGMNAHVGKPFDMDRLVTVVLQALGRPPQALPPAEAQPAKTTEPHADALLDLGPALQRMGHNQTLMRQAAASFGNDLPGLLAALRDDTGTATSPLATLHTLKGLTATLGLPKATAQCRALEAHAHSGRAIASADVDALQDVLKDSLDALVHALPAIGHPSTAPGLATALDLQGPKTPHGRAALMQLADLLAQSDMAALECFAQHRALFEVCFAADFDALDRAIQSLEFEEAAQTCATALQRA
ncbi:MAG: hypothetical protein CFE44_12960, partial [Burkholderiales bacterium PBB4]